MKARAAAGFFIGTLFVFHTVHAADPMSDLRELKEAAKWTEVQKKSLDLVEKFGKNNQPQELKWATYFLAQSKKALGQTTEALNEFRKISGPAEPLREFVLLQSAQLEFAMHNYKKAQEDLDALMELSPNLKVSLDAKILLARLHLAQKRFRDASVILKKLERQQRRQERHPEILLLLAQAQQELKQRIPFCQSLRKLYSQHPNYEPIQGWSLNLAEDLFQGKPTGCASSFDDRRARVRNLQWAGRSSEARKELENLKEKSRNFEDVFELDRLTIHFLLHEGEVLEALDVLRPHRAERFNDPQFQSIFATVAARLGDFQSAIGASYRAYQLAPKSKAAKQALFQSAFMSYQSRDYDGATRRFREFMRVFPRSGLSKDARWHLAWMSYLKGDFSGALTGFRDLQRVRDRRSSQPDRLRYWTAMTHVRLNQFVQAKPIFESIIKTSPQSFYGLAAKARMEQLRPQFKNGNGKSETPLLSQFSGLDVLRPWQENEASYVLSEEAESEESLQELRAGEEVAESVETDAGDAAPQAVAEEDAEKPEEEPKTSFDNPLLVRRFEKARELMILGETDAAKWELYDIERKTSNPQYLRTLMFEYEKVENFHRSSAIASNTFVGQRLQHGIEGVRYLWEIAYPKAHADAVSKANSRWGVSQELVWGIMRAESSYRRDAISPVGALGLMQVMPSTGLKLAELMGQKDFRPITLLEPAVAVNVGAFYLQRLSKKFQGTDSLVAASYNAGPHRVKAWLASFGFLDQDEFIEHIPFVETRNYVKRVLSNMSVYAQLYGQNSKNFSGLAEPMKVRFSEPPPLKESWEEI